MNLKTAIKTLTDAGYKITESQGSYIAEKDGRTISFFENGLGSGKCKKFTYMSDSSCSPTYGLTLKAAMS